MARTRNTEGGKTPPPDADKPTFQFEPHFGMPVVGAAINLNKVGANFAESLKLDPIELTPGEVFYFVGRAKVGMVGFDPIAGTDTLTRRHTADNELIKIVPGDMVREVLSQHEELLARAKEGWSQPPLGKDAGADHDPDDEPESD